MPSFGTTNKKRQLCYIMKQMHRSCRDRNWFLSWDLTELRKLKGPQRHGVPPHNLLAVAHLGPSTSASTSWFSALKVQVPRRDKHSEGTGDANEERGFVSDKSRRKKKTQSPQTQLCMSPQS